MLHCDCIQKEILDSLPRSMSYAVIVKVSEKTGYWEWRKWLEAIA